MDNKDVEGGTEWLVDVAAKLADGFSAFLNMLPPIVVGGIVAVLVLLWLVKKVKD